MHKLEVDAMRIVYTGLILLTVIVTINGQRRLIRDDELLNRYKDTVRTDEEIGFFHADPDEDRRQLTVR